MFIKIHNMLLVFSSSKFYSTMHKKVVCSHSSNYKQFACISCVCLTVSKGMRLLHAIIQYFTTKRTWLNEEGKKRGFFNGNMKSSGKKTAAASSVLHFVFYACIDCFVWHNIKMNARMEIIVWGGWWWRKRRRFLCTIAYILQLSVRCVPLLTQ